MDVDSPIVTHPCDGLDPFSIALGVLAETRVLCALLDMKREKKIKGFRKVRWGDRDDLRGVDFFVDVGGRTGQIQVKHGAARKRDVASYRRQGIYSITGAGYKDVREELEKIIVRLRCGVFG